MIQPLRTCHRRTFVVLAVVLPALFVAGLAARRQAAEPQAAAPDAYTLVSSDAGHWHQRHIKINVFTNTIQPGARWVQLVPQEELREPDALVYWSDAQPSGANLPAKARLLGALDPTARYALPENAEGFLIVYSLAHQTVVDATAFEVQR